MKFEIYGNLSLNFKFRRRFVSLLTPRNKAFRHTFTYPNFRILRTTEAKQSLKDSLLHKDSKYIQVIIVPYKHREVTAI